PPAGLRVKGGAGGAAGPNGRRRRLGRSGPRRPRAANVLARGDRGAIDQVQEARGPARDESVTPGPLPAGRAVAGPARRCRRGAPWRAGGGVGGRARGGRPAGLRVEGGLAGGWRNLVVVVFGVSGDAAAVLEEQGRREEDEARAERQARVDEVSAGGGRARLP